MRNSILLLTLGIISSIFFIKNQASADVVAYWRFEDGTAGTNVEHVVSNGTWAADIADASGNGNDLSTWETGGGAGYAYRADITETRIPQTGRLNKRSVKNTGGGPAMWTGSDSALRTMTFAQWTIEVSIKLENGGYRTIIGRDSQGTVAQYDNDGQEQSQWADLAGLYLQAIPNNALAIKFCDVTGIWHQAVSATNVFQGFDYSTDPEGELATWYNIAAVCDGTLLSLYLGDVAAGTGYQLIAQTNISFRSTDTTLTAGAGDGGDWDAGNWSVGRGLFAGGHGDRAYGFIDEVRISDSALSPGEFLFDEDYKNTVAYWRFEEGTADAQVSHGGLSNGEFYAGVLDVSGNGNHLSAWSETLGAFTYRSEVPASPVSRTNVDNHFSVQNSDSVPGMFTSSADEDSLLFDIETWTPLAFTIEVSFKPQSGSYRTIIGRDGMNIASTNAKLAALYFQIQPDDSIAIKFADVEGYWHQAVSDPGVIQYDGAGHWYHAVAVCDGQWLKLYLNQADTELGYQLAAQTDMSTSGSSDTRLVADTSSGSDWHGGGWSVGRGLYNGGHTDRFLGYIDEVRISSAALDLTDFLFYKERYVSILVTPEDLTIDEDDAAGGDLFFSLDQLPAGDVVLTVQEQNGRGQLTLDRTALTFTADNWDVPQAIHVTAVDDTDLENAEQNIPLAITVLSVSDEDYDALSADPVIVTILDDECGAQGYAIADFNLDCQVDVLDLAAFAAYWLECSSPDQEDCTDYFSGN